MLVMLRNRDDRPVAVLISFFRRPLCLPVPNMYPRPSKVNLRVYLIYNLNQTALGNVLDFNESAIKYQGPCNSRTTTSRVLNLMSFLVWLLLRIQIGDRERRLESRRL